MRDVVILHRTSRFKFDFADIDIPDQRLHIVTQAEKGVELTAAQIKHITSVVTVEDWTIEALEYAVAGFLPERDLGIDVLLVTHDEYSMLHAARLRELFDLRGPKVEQVLRFTNKPRMKELLREAGLRVPRWVEIANINRSNLQDAAEQIASVTGLPAFVKQVAGTCSEGAERIDTMPQLVSWLSRDDLNHDEFEVDEFVTGQLLHVDCVIQGGQITHAQTTVDTFPNAEAVSERPLGSLTLPPESELGRRMMSFNEQCLAALSPLIDGTTHLEMFDTGNELVFLEVAARSPGGDCPRAFEVRSGINFQSVFFRIHLGLPVNLAPTEGPWVAWCWYPWSIGRVTHIHQPRISSEFEMTSAAKVGDVATGGVDTRDRAVRVFAVNQDFETIARDFDLLRYEFEPVQYESL